jgi:hypothetical protein
MINTSIKLELQNKKNLQSFFFIFFFLTVSRLIPHEPNFTPVLSISILGFLFSKILSFKVLIVLGSMFFSDLIIGTHDFITYVYFSLMILIIISNSKNYIYMTLLGPLIFFIITNFGVWLSSVYYTKNIDGLIECFYMAIPFFKNTILSTFFYCILNLLTKNFYQIQKKYKFNFFFKN